MIEMPSIKIPAYAGIIEQGGILMPRVKLYLVLTSISLFFAGSAQSQDDSVTLVQSITVSVKAGMNGAFEEYTRALKEASQASDGEGRWYAAQSISGEPVYRFDLQMSGWSGLADPSLPLLEHFGEAETMRLFGLFQDSVASMHTAFYEQRASMSNLPESMDAPPEALVYIDFSLNPGGAQAFMELTQKTAEASRAVTPDAYFVGAMGNMGASGPRTILLIPSFSDMDGPQPPGPAQRVMQHFGESEGTRINAMAQEAVASFEFSLFRNRPDLAYPPGN